MKWSKLALPALIPFALVGCLDTGSSSDDSNNVSFDPITYTGEGSTLVTFSASNQDDFVGLLPAIFDIEESILDIEEGLWGATGFSDTATSGDKTISGSCGGTVNFAFTLNETTGDYTETITASNYCDKNVFSTEVGLNGELVISGTYDGTDDKKSGLEFDDFSFKADAYETDFGLDGAIAYNYPTSTTVNANIVGLAVVNRVANKSGFLENLVRVIGVDGPISFDGTVHVKDQGKATLTTTTEISQWNEGTPINGVVEFQGTNTLTVTLNPGEPTLSITN